MQQTSTTFSNKGIRPIMAGNDMAPCPALCILEDIRRSHSPASFEWTHLVDSRSGLPAMGPRMALPLSARRVG